MLALKMESKTLAMGFVFSKREICKLKGKNSVTLHFIEATMVSLLWRLKSDFSRHLQQL